jgi:superoxide dismutase, Cu-Zn family
MAWKGLTTTLLATGVVVFGLGAARPVVAQDATPIATPIVGVSQVSVAIRDVDGIDVGTATLTEGDDGIVTVEIEIQGLPAGDHGIHVHETGICDPTGDEPFSSAGGHFNPASSQHGGPPSDSGTSEATATGHAGDLGNIAIAADGSGTATVDTDRLTLGHGSTALQDADGSAFVVHADPDDLSTDPSGNSGARIACGVVFPPADATPVASA